MTTTKTTCDGCGKEFGDFDEGWVEPNEVLIDERPNGVMDRCTRDMDGLFCPDCWKKMTDAVKPSGPTERHRQGIE